MVAGPIVRFRQIEEDLEALGQSDRYRWMHRGMSFFDDLMRLYAEREQLGLR